MLVKKSVFDGDDTNREDIYEGNDVEEVRPKNLTVVCFARFMLM